VNVIFVLFPNIWPLQYFRRTYLFTYLHTYPSYSSIDRRTNRSTALRTQSGAPLCRCLLSAATVLLTICDNMYTWKYDLFTRVVWKVRGLTLLLRVGTLWRCGNGLFCQVPPLASDALLTTLHPLLENVPQTVDYFEISCLGASFSWLERPRNFMGRDLDCMADVLMGFHRSTFSKPNTEFNSDLAPCDFWAFRTV
jgi:hypothetical protein